MIPQICISISLEEFLSPDAVNADAKLMKQQVFETFWWYATSGDWISYSI